MGGSLGCVEGLRKAKGSQALAAGPFYCRGPGPQEGCKPSFSRDGFSACLCQKKSPGSLPTCAPQVPGPVGGCASSDGPGLLDRPLASSFCLTLELSAVQALPPRAYACTHVRTHVRTHTHAHTHSFPSRGLGGDLGGRCPLTASIAPSSKVENELSCFLPSLFSGLLGEATAHLLPFVGCVPVTARGHSRLSSEPGPAGMVFVWLMCHSCENWSPHL